MSIPVPLEGFGGGGGASLNFDVKAYATEEALLAAVPKENTIGVITQTAITSWAFSATEPAEPVAGMVWISTGNSSGVAFNALKKNAIQVYPLSAKQYVDGAWVDVIAMSYQGGEWVGWITYLYNYGQQRFAWQSRGQSYNGDSAWAGQAPKITKNDDGSVTLSIDTVYAAAGFYELAEDIDMTNVKELTLLYKCTANNSSRLTVHSASAYPMKTAIVAEAVLKSTSAWSTITLDCSAITGKYRVGIAIAVNLYGSDYPNSRPTMAMLSY